ADAVAQQLGDLPLGLAQAAATIGRQHLTYSMYLERLRQVPVRELLGRGPGEDYPHATAAALLLSVQATEASDPAGLAGWLLRVRSERDQARGQWAGMVAAALNLLEPLLFSEAQAWSRREDGARLGAQVEALWDADAGAGTGDRDLALRQLRARSWAVRQLRA